MERDVQKIKIIPLRDNFNSHAHVERDIEKHIDEKYNGISTHTLTWSVTYINYNRKNNF